MLFAGVPLASGTMHSPVPLMVEWNGTLVRIPQGLQSLPAEVAAALHGGGPWSKPLYNSLGQFVKDRHTGNWWRYLLPGD
jgi:hypothetical protein